MKNKKTEAKRLVIFLVLAFALAWIPWIIMNVNFEFEDWFMGEKQGTFMWLLLLSGGAPAIANVLTRLITKEGLQDDMLRLKFRRHIKYYVLALAIPLLAGLCRGLAATAIYGDFSGEPAMSGKMAAASCMQAVWMSLIMAFNTFGEEYGWRAYMNPKLLNLTNKPVTIIVGGILWGVWHAPLTVVGHNFGTDYPGFPWLGIVLMSAFCILTGMFLMWLTLKTGSIYPAAIAHSANNNGATMLTSAVLIGVPDNLGISFSQRTAVMFFLAIFYAVFGILLYLDSRKEKAHKKEPQNAETT